MHRCQLKSNFHKTRQEYVATHNGVIFHPKFEEKQTNKAFRIFHTFPQNSYYCNAKKLLACNENLPIKKG